MEPEEVMDLLRERRDRVVALEPDDETLRELKEARKARDETILAALDAGVPERLVCDAAGITRGWLWRLKNRSSQPTRRSGR